MSSKQIELRIDELILEGLPYDQRQRVSAVIERELTQLLVESLIGNSLDSERDLLVHQVEVSPHWSAEKIGRHVAQSAYQQIVNAGSINGLEIS